MLINSQSLKLKVMEISDRLLVAVETLINFQMTIDTETMSLSSTLEIQDHQNVALELNKKQTTSTKKKAACNKRTIKRATSALALLPPLDYLDERQKVGWNDTRSYNQRHRPPPPPSQQNPGKK